MTLSPLVLFLIVLAAVVLGWCARSYALRKYPAETAKFDSAAKQAGDRAEAEYDAFKQRVGK